MSNRKGTLIFKMFMFKCFKLEIEGKEFIYNRKKNRVIIVTAFMDYSGKKWSFF